MTLLHTIKDNQHRQLKRLLENTAWKVATFQVNHRTLEMDTWPLSLHKTSNNEYIAVCLEASMATKFSPTFRLL
jgi:hypothetical protein